MTRKKGFKKELCEIELTQADLIIISRLAIQEFDTVMSFVHDSVKEKFKDDESIVFISKLNREELERVHRFCQLLHALFCKTSTNVTPEQLDLDLPMEKIKEKMFVGLAFCSVVLSSQGEISLDD